MMQHSAAGIDRGDLIQYGTALAAAVLVLGPIIPIAYQSIIDRPLYESGALLDWRNYARLFSHHEFLEVAVNSALFAALTTILSIAIGATVAIFTARTRMRGAGLASSLMLLPMYISPLVLSFGWIILYGPAGYMTLVAQSALGFAPWNIYTIAGMAAAASVAYAPLAYLYCSGALMLADPSLEDAIRICGAGPLQVLRRVTIPLLRPPIIYSALLIFSSALELLSIPLILGKPVGITTFASFLFDIGLARTNPDYGALGAASMVLLLLGVLLVVMQMSLLRQAQRFISVRGKAARQQLLDLGPLLKTTGVTAIWLYLLLGSILPIFALLARSFTSVLTPFVSPFSVLTLENFELILTQRSYVISIWNSILVATIGAVVTTLLAALAVLVARRSTFRFRNALQVIALAPQGVPAILVGLGFFWFFAWVTPIGWVRGTLLALIIAFTCRTLPIAYGAIAPVVGQIGGELDQAARTVGADWWHTVSRVLFRLLVPALFSSFVLVFVQMMKELSSAIFLVTSDTQIIGTTALQLWFNGDTGSVAALAVMEVIIIVLFVFFAGRVLKVRMHA